MSQSINLKSASSCNVPGSVRDARIEQWEKHLSPGSWHASSCPTVWCLVWMTCGLLATVLPAFEGTGFYRVCIRGGGGELGGGPSILPALGLLDSFILEFLWACVIVFNQFSWQQGPFVDLLSWNLWLRFFFYLFAFLLLSCILWIPCLETGAVSIFSQLMSFHFWWAEILYFN